MTFSVVRRILVYGVTGSGKSTLARRIAERLHLPYHAVDDLTWLPGWVPVPTRQQHELIAAVCGGNDIETWRDAFLSRESIVVWHFRSFARKRRRMRAWYQDPAMPPVILLRSPAEVERWLDGL